MNTNNVLLSMVGAHAGEDLKNIFNRKISDINSVGYTFWLFYSVTITPQKIKTYNPKTVYFLSTKYPNINKSTIRSDRGKCFTSWTDNTKCLFDGRLSPITGKMSSAAKCLKLEDINLYNTPQMFNFDNNIIKFSQFAGTHIYDNSISTSNDYRYCVGTATIIDVGSVS